MSYWHMGGTPREFMRDVQALRLPTDSPIDESDIAIAAVEVAVDLRHPTNDVNALASAAAHIRKHLAHPPPHQPRITEAGRYRAAGSPSDDLKALRDGWTINFGRPPNADIGDPGDDHRVRIYVKTSDTRDGKRYHPLPTDQWRTRLENSLQGANLPFHTLQGWREFKFESLCRDRFALVVPVGDGTVATLQDRSPQLGRPLAGTGTVPPTGALARSRRPGYRNKRQAATRRDTPANKAIYDALRGLTRASSRQNFGKSSPAKARP